MGSVSEDLVPSEHFGPASRKCRTAPFRIVTGVARVRDGVDGLVQRPRGHARIHAFADALRLCR